MKIAAILTGLLGSSVALIVNTLGLFSNIQFNNLDTLGYSVATFIGLIGTLGIVLVIIKPKRTTFKITGTVLVICDIVYLYLILLPWPFRLGYFEFMSLASIIVIYFTVPVTLVGALLFFLISRKIKIQI